MTRTSIKSVFETLVQEHDGRSVTWEQIVQAVKDKNIKVTNWMTVRGWLQGFINAGHLKRVNDVRTEAYQVTANPA